MPPENAPKPTAAARETFTAALEATLDRSAARRLDPGAPALHRLNRAEYANAIRDLLALDVDVSALLPPDDSSAGFDNIADVLGVSPALIEGYVAAAARVSRLAIGDPSIGLDRVVYRVPATSRRMRTSKVSHSARVAASSSATRSRSTRSTTCKSVRQAAHDLVVLRRRARAPTISTWRSTARGSRSRAAEARRDCAYRLVRTRLRQRRSSARARPAPTEFSTSSLAPRA